MTAGFDAKDGRGDYNQRWRRVSSLPHLRSYVPTYLRGQLLLFMRIHVGVQRGHHDVLMGTIFIDTELA